MPDSRWASISTIEILTIEVRRKVRRMMKGPVETTAYIRCCAGGPGHHPCVARRSELVALEVRDIDFWPNGTGQAVIRRGKTDSEGQGRVAYLSRETVRWLKIWLEHATINEGPIFRRFIGRDQIGNALHPGSIAPIFKRVAQWIGMPAKFVAEVSGHSTRVGAAQDLAELDIDLAATGRDKSVPEEG
jgi:integrase